MAVSPYPKSDLTRAPSRYLYLGLGVLCTGLGIVGYILPIMPGTVFLIVAAWAFSKSSPRLEAWLLEHPWFGTTLKNWFATKSISVRTKLISISVLWCGLVGSAIGLQRYPVALAIVIAVVVWVTWFIASRRTAAA
jgi:uncharacterized membrane protein YbaN (DUF454 family)